MVKCKGLLYLYGHCIWYGKGRVTNILGLSYLYKIFWLNSTKNGWNSAYDSP